MWYDFYQDTIVLRSTVPPGTSKQLGCCFMPEFLTEKIFEKDFINNQKWVFWIDGSKDSNLQWEMLTKL